MNTDCKRLTLFAGHYGSGKTNIAVNYALKLRADGKPVVIHGDEEYETNLQENPNNAEINNSLGMCYLKLGFYDRALAKFDKAIEQDLNNPETYLYAAVCILAGRKPFLTPRAEIDKIEQYINAALMIEERGLFRYFQAYIKYDYFKRKFFKTSPTWEECLMQARADGLSETDVNQLFEIIKQEIPSCF